MITTDYVLQYREEWAVDGVCMFIIQRPGVGFSLTYHAMEVGG